MKENETYDGLTARLSDPDPNRRLDALEALVRRTGRARPGAPESVNSHIHTDYSFSPYSPSLAVFLAARAGLSTAGLVDHDTVAGAREFLAAGRIAGLSTTVGVELRADMSRTALDGRRINSPDQRSLAYLVLHGIPHTQLRRVDEFLAPYRAARNVRNRAMTERLDALFSPFGVRLDFDRDVLPLSRAAAGGSVTERHLLYALARGLTERYGRGPGLLSFLRGEAGLTVGGEAEARLSDPRNPYYEYDLLDLLKAGLTPRFYIDATGECPPVADVLAFSERIGAISAYAYLGDSAADGRPARKFEDDYLDELFDTLCALGFRAVTYMPSRNTPAQLARVRALCERRGLLQISGEDVNSPRQPFARRGDGDLVRAAWALIGHELSATLDPKLGMFSPETVRLYPDLGARTAFFDALGRELSGEILRFS